MSQPNSINTIMKNSGMNFKERKKAAPKKERFIMTEQLKQEFYSEAKKYYAKNNRLFIVDENNKTFLNLFCKYFSNDETFETVHKGELQKGLFITGNKGTGKTSSFQIIQNISRKYNLRKLWFPMIETPKVVEQYNTEKNKDYIVKRYSKGNFFFDDLGAEDPASNIFVYGKQDIFIRILENRYNEFITKGTKTYITSNLSIEDIKKRYGERVEDRFIQMFNLLELVGKSRRL